MHYQHLFFDLDHTLWDFDANSRLTLNELYLSFDLKARGIADRELFHQNYLMHNNALWERYRSGSIKVDELRWKRFWLTLLDFKIGDQPLARRLGTSFLELLPKRTLLFPHARESLQWLKEKQYKLHLITNGFENTQHTKLRNAGIYDYFQAIVTSEGASSLKPHKEIFEYALRITGASTRESIMIGDNVEVDIQGAVNAGMDQVFVNHLHVVPAIKPTYIIYDLKQLQDIF